MHNPAEDADYEWPTCTACNKQLWDDEYERRICRPCEDKTRNRLTELPDLFARLSSTAALMRGASGGGAPTSGSKTPPIPPRLDVLNLVSAGGAAARLQAVEDSWRQALGWDTPPTVEHRTTFPITRTRDGQRHIGQPFRSDRVYPHWRTPTPDRLIPARITFLTNNLPWAADTYESVAQDVEEIRRLHAECKAAIANERKPGRVKAGLCPVRINDQLCRAQLTAVATNHRIRCGTCGTEWADLGAWRQLRQAQDAVLAEAAGAAA